MKLFHRFIELPVQKWRSPIVRLDHAEDGFTVPKNSVKSKRNPSKLTSLPHRPSLILPNVEHESTCMLAKTEPEIGYYQDVAQTRSIP
jgi:hypothetical protein